MLRKKEKVMLNSRKIYYSIREVCNKTGLEPHVLRYWESEFLLLHPQKNRAGNRAYRQKDIETILTIKHLLYEEQYTIAGAKKKLLELKNKLSNKNSTKSPEQKEFMKEVLKELHAILNTLNEGKK